MAKFEALSSSSNLHLNEMFETLLCQDYKQAECPRYNEAAAERFLFKDEEQFLNWLALSRSSKLRSLHQRYLVHRAQRWQRKSTK